MRTHVYAWTILGIAVFAQPWDTLEKPRQGDRQSGTPSVVRAHGLLPAASTTVAISNLVPRPDIVDAAASPTLRGEPVSQPTQRAPEPAAIDARPFVPSPAVAVREIAPGSDAHSEAIASNIASEEFQDLVSPLARLYLAYFNRPPDYEGFDYYIDERYRGEALAAIADEFAGSPEFNARYGSLDNATFVDRVFENVFNGAGDAAQRAYWTAQLESGAMTRGQVMLAFSEGPAFRAATGNEVLVATAYAETLGRAPDPADFARWVAFLDAGNPPRTLIDELLAGRGKR